MRFEDSIKEVPIGAPVSQPHRVRDNLITAELAENLDFVVSLRMRNFDELETRIHSRHLVPQADMESKYLPTRADHDRVAAWLKGQGFTLTLVDSNHTNIFVRGTIAQISAALSVTFARVATADGEFTSAVAVPSLPEDISGEVLGIDGLQPHILMHAPKPQPDLVVTSVSGLTTPADVLAAYNVPSNLNGSGQTIAIIMGATPLSSDLSAFWQAIGVTEVLTNYTLVNVLGGPTAASQSANAREVALDTEWATGVAPGAKLRVYAIPTTALPNLMAACTQIINDGVAKTASYSASTPEIGLTAGSVQASSQTFALLAAAGVTLFTGSGDSGSNPNTNGVKGYSPSNALSVMYPASDPNITGVSGTVLSFNSNWVATTETVWSQIGSNGVITAATGGGISIFFSRPSWQSGTGVPLGATRCVPDVAAMSMGDSSTGTLGAIVISNGQQIALGGTSLASPIWNGLTTLVNQARAQAGLPSIGHLAPYVYPLIGSNAFKDITTGTNGAYSAGVGYDLCTGVGTPNVANLISALVNAPAFTIAPSGTQSVTAGQVVMLTTSASGPGTLIYQWQSQSPGSTIWNNVTNGAGISGANAPTLSITASAAQSGVSYQCVVQNMFSSDTSMATTLRVATPITVTTLAGSPSAESPVTGSLASARFADNTGLAVDAAGNIYVADYGWSIITKISAGSVTTLAGSQGNLGSTDGIGGAARFANPWGIAVDSSGNVFVADSKNNTIRKITPSGTVTTLAGTAGVTGSADGAGAAASFNFPTGLALDPTGNLYVCDTNNSTIRKVTSAGVVSTLAGSVGNPGLADGTGANALFDVPRGIAIDVSGNLYVADSGNNSIRKVTLAGFVTTVAGGVQGSADGLGAQAQFNSPYGLAVDAAGDIFVADSVNNLIREITPAGVVTTIAGSATTAGSTDGIGSAALFDHPDAIAVTAGGQLYVADTRNYTIRTAATVLPPIFTSQPVSQTIANGSTVVFLAATVPAGSAAPGYQWQLNGVNIAGATGARLVVPNAGAANAGSYTCVASSSSGLSTSVPATLTVTTTTNPGRLINLSVLTPLAAGETMTMGTVLGGAGTSGTKPLLVRAGGPSLAQFGITAFLPNPTMTLNNTSVSPAVVVATNTKWGGATALSNAFAAVGAFPYTSATSNDSAIFQPSLAAGNYTVQVSDASGGSGTVIAELYDATPGSAFTAATPRLINVSVLKQINPGAALTVGFVISGSSAKTVLIRAVGPRLGLAPFNIPGVMPAPTMTLVNTTTGATVATNSGWGGDPQITGVASSVGAFAVTDPASKDAMLLVTLAPANYTAQVGPASGTAGGTAIVEVYEVP